MKLITMWFLACLSAAISVSAAADANFKALRKQKWLLIESPHFSIMTDANEKLGVKLIDDLEAYHHINSVIFAKQNNQLPALNILAINKNSTFRSLGLERSIAGIFSMAGNEPFGIANISGYKGATQRKATFAKQTLFHEYVHYLTAYENQDTDLPLWFSEGRAEYLGTFWFDEKHAYFGDIYALKDRIPALYGPSGVLQISSDTILTKQRNQLNFSGWNNGSTFEFYGRAFFIYHYFNSSSEKRQQLLKLVNAQKTMNAADALKEATGMTFDELDNAVEKYVMGDLQMRVFSITEGSWNIPKTDYKIKTLTPNEAEMRLHGTFKRRDKNSLDLL